MRGGGVFVGGWVSEWVFGQVALVYVLILTLSMSTVCLTQFGQKVDCVSFGKMLVNYLEMFLQYFFK